jgi:hypothetical protein
MVLAISTSVQAFQAAEEAEVESETCSERSRSRFHVHSLSPVILPIAYIAIANFLISTLYKTLP